MAEQLVTAHGELQAQFATASFLQDGSSTDGLHVEAGLDETGGLLIIHPNGRVDRHDLDKLVVSSRMRGVPLRVVLPDSNVLTVPDGELAKKIALGRAGFLAQVEGRPFRYWPPLLVGSAIVFWLLYAYAMPALGGFAARHMPVSFINSIGDKYWSDHLAPDLNLVEETGDGSFSAARLESLGEEALSLLPNPVAEEEEGYNYRFMLADAEQWGANAFALPNGHIVMTTELAEMLSEDEIFAVLAHEVAHVDLRHSMQRIARLSVWGVISAMLLGDYTFALVGLAELSYSREDEAEADCYAIGMLNRGGRDPHIMLGALGAIHEVVSGEEGQLEADEEGASDEVAREIEELERERKRKRGEDPDAEVAEEPEEGEDGDSDVWKYLSSHPVGEERDALARECIQGLQ